MASEVDQRFPDAPESGITVLRLPDEALDRRGDVPVQSAIRPESERTVRAGQHEIGVGRLAWLAARLLVRSAGCTQPSWSATQYIEQWLGTVLLASHSRVLLCSNDSSPLGVLAVRAAERAAADTVYVQHGAWVEGQTSSHAQRCRHIAVMGACDVRARSKEARGLPTGRPAKLNATTRAGAAQRIKDGAIPEQVAAELGVSRSTLCRELRKHREGAAAEPVGQEG
ncbi:helix-turn-helix domain-containing protein [Streptomyces mirabilis]|uniref:helix-turn-helix domain-containing protein n=1 Tax=Streptomyces mirabilis TaxID=68239 RepID=UPI00364FC547